MALKCTLLRDKRHSQRVTWGRVRTTIKEYQEVLLLLVIMEESCILVVVTQISAYDQVQRIPLRPSPPTGGN